MTQISNIGRVFAAALCTLVFSATMVLGAVAPAQPGGPSAIVRAIA